MTVAVATLVAAAIAVPHVARLEGFKPASAAVVWFCVLMLRALTTVAAAVFAFAVLPTTQIFSLITHWCWHTVLPVVTAHLGLDGHRVGDAAIILPGFLLAASLVWVAFGVLRAARAVRSFVHHAQLGPGPAGSVMVAGPDVVVAAAGLHRPQVVVSAGALVTLDDDELAASLDHERGHIERQHRFVLLMGQLLAALGRPLPGTRAAMSELAYHLERDADAFAVGRRHDPLALASAICKAAVGSLGGTSAVATALGGAGPVSRRVVELASGSPTGRATCWTRVLTAGMVVLTIVSMIGLPVAAASTDTSAVKRERHCIT